MFELDTGTQENPTEFLPVRIGRHALSGLWRLGRHIKFMRQKPWRGRGPRRVQFHATAGVCPNQVIFATLERADGFLEQAPEGRRTPRPEDLEAHVLFPLQVQQYHAVTACLAGIASDRALLAEDGLHQFLQSADGVVTGDFTADPQDEHTLRPGFFGRTLPLPFPVPLVRQNLACAGLVPPFDVGELIVILWDIAGCAEGGANRVSIPNACFPALPGRSTFRRDEKDGNGLLRVLVDFVIQLLADSSDPINVILQVPDRRLDLAVKFRHAARSLKRVLPQPGSGHTFCDVRLELAPHQGRPGALQGLLHHDHAGNGQHERERPGHRNF